MVRMNFLVNSCVTDNISVIQKESRYDRHKSAGGQTVDST